MRAWVLVKFASCYEGPRQFIAVLRTEDGNKLPWSSLDASPIAQTVPVPGLGGYFTLLEKFGYNAAFCEILTLHRGLYHDG